MYLLRLKSAIKNCLYYGDSQYPCYNGNIGMSGIGDRAYIYGYDHANRLVSARYMAPEDDGGTRPDYSATYAYDRNSNITSLTRKGVKDVTGSYGLVDDLTMTYSGNRLWRVTDHAGEVLLENSGNLRNPDIFDPSETQFGYDGNGNTVKDLSRNIETMSYNAINLPLSAQLAQGTDALTGTKTRRSIGYTYDASGVRHRVIHTTQPMLGTRPLKIATADTTDYVGNYVIRNGKIDKILTPYGYMQNGRHHTFLHDYQGNVAAVVVGDSVAQRNTYYPYGLPHVTGLIKLQPSSSNARTANPYKYGGKEYDTFGGTDLYDFHARYHAPSTCRFMTIDPMAEKYPGISPYMYCAGNPIAYIDPDGMQIFVNIDDMIYYYREIEKGRYGFVDEDGNEYDEDDKFIKSLGNALSKLQSKSVGKWLVDSLIADERELQVVESYSDNAYDVMGAKYIVSWNPHNTHGGPCESQTEPGEYDILRPAFIGLGHEFAHAYDKWSGTWDKRAWYFQDLTIQDRKDIFACHIENMIRAEHSLPLRTHYGFSKWRLNEANRVVWGGISLYYGPANYKNPFKL